MVWRIVTKEPFGEGYSSAMDKERALAFAADLLRNGVEIVRMEDVVAGQTMSEADVVKALVVSTSDTLKARHHSPWQTPPQA